MNFSKQINVVPAPFYQEPKMVKYYKFAVVGFTPFTSMEFSCCLFSTTDQTIDYVQVVMEGDDYNKWGNDDTYLINFLNTKLGFTYDPSAETTTDSSAETTTNP